MFEAAMERVRRLAEEKAGERTGELAGRIAAAVPPDIDVRTEGADVVLAGRGLKRRFLLDERLKWLMAEIGR